MIGLDLAGAIPGWSAPWHALQRSVARGLAADVGADPAPTLTRIPYAASVGQAWRARALASSPADVRPA